MKIRYFVGMSIAMLTDLGMGILILHLTGKALGYQVSAPFYVIGMLLPLIPDLNVLLLAIRGKRIDEKHRTFDHYPIVMIPVFFFILYFISVFWATVVSLCLFYHYIHDSLETEGGTGVKWLGPIGEKYYKFFAKKNGKRRLISASRYEDFEEGYFLTLEEWLENGYLKLTYKSSFGITVFFVAIFLSLIW